MLCAVAILAAACAFGGKKQAVKQLTFNAFDPSVESVGKSFRGMDFPRLVEPLKRLKTQLEKSEYETTDAFNARIEELLTKPLGKGTYTPNSTVAFLIPTHLVDASYDADNRTVTLSTVSSVSRINELHFIVFNGSPSYYTGRNAFNRAVRVKRYVQLVYTMKLDFPGGDARPLTLPPLDLDLDKEDEACEKATAAVCDASITIAAIHYKYMTGVVLVGRLHEPFYDESMDTSEPTIDDPEDVTIFEHKFFMNVQEVWLIDTTSGRVYKKYKAEDVRL